MMPKKPISAFLVFAVALVTVLPLRTFAQAPAPPTTSIIESTASAQPASSDLKRSLAAELVKSKSGPLTAADLKRLQKEQQNQQFVNSAKPGWTRKQKIFLALWIVVMAGVVVVLIKHACKDEPCPEIDYTDYNNY